MKKQIRILIYTLLISQVISQIMQNLNYDNPCMNVKIPSVESCLKMSDESKLCCYTIAKYSGEGFDTCTVVPIKLVGNSKIFIQTNGNSKLIINCFSHYRFLLVYYMLLTFIILII